MNIPNLLKMAEYIATVPQEMFDMENWRDIDANWEIPECKSVGCVIGHCAVLDKNPLPKSDVGSIIFEEWSEKFTGLIRDSRRWEWCFSPTWRDSDNTPIGASKRINYLIEHGLPENWKEQMNGEAELSY